MSELKKKKKTSQIFLYLPIFFTLVFTTSLFLESSHNHKIGKNSSCQICLISHDKNFDTPQKSEIKIVYQEETIKISEEKELKFISKIEKKSRAPPKVS